MLFVLFQTCIVTLLLNDVRYGVGVRYHHVHSLQLPGQKTANWSLCGEDLCWCSDEQQEAQCLDLSGNITSLPRLPQSVRVLKLSFDESFRNLTNAVFFYNVSHITRLHLLRSEVESLNNHSFVWATNLTSLHIQKRFVSVGKAQGMDFIAPLFSIPSLRFLNAPKCNLRYRPRKTLHAVGQSQIETLRLNGNLFPETVDLGEFAAVFKQLKRLYLRRNAIRFVVSDHTLQLKELYLDKNSGVFPETCRGNESLYPKLEVLSLKFNLDYRYPDGSLLPVAAAYVLPKKVCLPRLQALWLSDNAVYDIPSDFFSDTNFPSLTRINFTNFYPWGMKIHPRAFCNKRLTFLTLVSNGIDFAQTTQVDDEAFAEMPHLQTLLLDNNNFMNISDRLFHRLFGGLLSLARLSLSNCQFTTFTRQTFAIFPHLSLLNLRENKIMELPDGILEPLPNLKSLDLSMNRLVRISEGSFSLPFRQSLLTLDLRLNRFQCSCELMWLAKWMATNPDVFSYPDSTYNCQNIPGTDISEFLVDQEHACLLTREINILIIFSVSLSIISLLSFSLAYRYRWHVRMLLYEVFRGRDNIRRRHLQADHFQYDVFVSYASEDLPWIRNHLMPNLENDLGLRLCIHETDFIPGKSIVENIADCVESSKKILVVYSNDFVRSQWCQFELTYCLRHVMDYDDALIIVCVGDVLSRRMTSAMMAVLKTTTYIQWAPEEDAVRSFWRRLRLALQEVTKHAERV